jgi:ABC-type uncharacterized transport system substrate-binding protein
MMIVSFRSLVKQLITPLALFLIVTGVAHAADSPSKAESRTKVIGYYQGGEYSDYQSILIETIRGLMQLGVIESKNIPDFPEDSANQIWSWLSENADSDRVRFSKEHFYTADWDDHKRDFLNKKILKSLNSGEVDLMIAMGTWAGQDLANGQHTTDTLVISASEPVLAGIVPSVDDSGFEHIHATMDPDRYHRQLVLFHQFVGFKKLGVAYEDSVEGRSYSAVDIIEATAKELNFEIVPCYSVSDTHIQEKANESFLGCIDTLSQTTDAIYLTAQGGLNSTTLPVTVQLLNERHIPTFSQSGGSEVKKGVLMSLSQAGFKYVGHFHAETIDKVLKGARPGHLSQVFQEPPGLALNLKTAKDIGFNPPIVLLGMADELYNKIYP